MSGLLRVLFDFLNFLSSAASWPTDGYKFAFRDCGCGGLETIVQEAARVGSEPSPTNSPARSEKEK